MSQQPALMSWIFIELGLIVLGLAILARTASRWGLSTIPLYLIVGLAFGNGGVHPLGISEEFVQIGAEIGILLLLFMLGLEYTSQQLKQEIKKGLSGGILDLVLNFTPGMIAGYLLGWSTIQSALLGGVTYISSSGITAKVLSELNRLKNPETPGILSVLVLEDVVMAIYLPLIATLLLGHELSQAIISISIALYISLFLLFIILNYSDKISLLLSHQSDEIILLTIFGSVLLVSGIVEQFQISAAIGAFLVGITLSGPIAHNSQRLIGPLRDLFAAIFFFFFGLQINPAAITTLLPAAIILAIVTACTKIYTGWWIAKKNRLDSKASLRAGTALIARGEFSIIIANLGAATTIGDDLTSFAAAYVLLLAITGPIFTRFADPIYDKVQKLIH